MIRNPLKILLGRQLSRRQVRLACEGYSDEDMKIHTPFRNTVFVEYFLSPNVKEIHVYKGGQLSQVREYYSGRLIGRVVYDPPGRLVGERTFRT